MGSVLLGSLLTPFTDSETTYRGDRAPEYLASTLREFVMPFVLCGGLPSHRALAVLVPLLLVQPLGSCGSLSRSDQVIVPSTATRNGRRDQREIERALERHVHVLASDAYEGRLPGTKGDSLTVAYTVKEYQKIGLAPGGPAGLWQQPVPLLTRSVVATAIIRARGRTIVLHAPGDMYMRDVPAGESAVNGSHALFVGYGVVAPQQGRDDYHGRNVVGNVVFMIAGQPPASTSDAAKGQTAVTWGAEATPEGKVAAAMARGVAAVVFIHDSTIAGYGFSLLRSQWGDNAIRPDTATAGQGRQPMVSLYIPHDHAQAILAATGHDLSRLEDEAASGGMAPLALDLSVQVRSTTRVRRFTSPNLIGRIEGTDRSKRSQAIVYTAHWDHLGRDTTLRGDQIYNGAVDNAGGIAELLEIARMFRRITPRSPRTLVFIATTAEEEGQLGASYYVAHPTYPLSHTLADINLDFFEPWGRTRDVINYGPTGSTLDDVFGSVARAEGRSVTPDPTPEENFWQRGDQYRFALAGVPSIFPAPGIRYVGRSDSYGLEKAKDFTVHDYHQVSDEMRSDWDWSGAAQEVEFLTQLGYRIARESRHPIWKASTMCPSCRARRAAASDHPG
jgi:hypothetical protein